jgi:predicted neutral ceramidase superfamily lipid hydrolase
MKKDIIKKRIPISIIVLVIFVGYTLGFAILMGTLPDIFIGLIFLTLLLTVILYYWILDKLNINMGNPSGCAFNDPLRRV